MPVKDQTRPEWRKIKPDDPKRLAKLIEAAFELDTLRKVYEREAGGVNDEVKQIKALIIHDFEKSAIQEITTRLGTARFVTKTIPISDPDAGGWEATYAYMVQEALEQVLVAQAGQIIRADLYTKEGSKKAAKLIAKFVATHGFWDLIQKRLGEKACQARWEEKQKIPGVKQFEKGDIKLGDAEQPRSEEHGKRD